MAAADPTPTPAAPFRLPGVWYLAALAVSLIAVAGSLLMTLALGLKPCPLCYYQRTFALGVAGVLLMGLLAPARLGGFASLFALPLAMAAWCVARWHVRLEAAGTMECPAGFLGWGTTPQQSEVVLIVLLLLVALDVRFGEGGRMLGFLPLAGGLLLGVALAYGAIKSATPMPPPSKEEYDRPPDICRPVKPPA